MMVAIASSVETTIMRLRSKRLVIPRLSERKAIALFHGINMISAQAAIR